MMKNACLLRNVSVCVLFLALCLVLVGYVESLEELTQPFFNIWNAGKACRSRWNASTRRRSLPLSGSISSFRCFFQETFVSKPWETMRLPFEPPKGKTNDAFRGLPSHVKTFLDLYASLTGYDAFARVLKKHGVATTPTRLDRIGKQVCLVAGATADQTGKPQVWLDKWLAAPVRLLLEGKDEKALRLELHNWTSPVTDDRFPQVIDFVSDENVIERWETISVKRLDTPGKLFKLEEKK